MEEAGSLPGNDASNTPIKGPILAHDGQWSAHPAIKKQPSKQTHEHPHKSHTTFHFIPPSSAAAAVALACPRSKKPVGPQLDQLGLVPVPVRRKRSLPRLGLVVRDLLARCRQNDWQDGVSVGDQQTRSMTHSKKLDFPLFTHFRPPETSAAQLVSEFGFSFGGGGSSTITNIGRLEPLAGSNNPLPLNQG